MRTSVPLSFRPVCYSVRSTRYSVLGCLLLGLLGCLHGQPRLQSDDEGERDKDLTEIKTIGDVTDVSNAQPVPVSGVGLVVGLDGTGGRANPDGYRTWLENELLKQRFEHVKEALESPSTSVVIVSALLPPGVREGDPFDVEITLPPQSRTTSLQGGYLQKCSLYDGSTTKTIDPNYTGANRVLKGHALARAEGPLLVGFGDGDEALRLRHGRIWGGGHSKLDRPYYVVLKNDEQRAPLAQKVGDRINETLQGNFRGAASQLATAKSNKLIVLRVPEQYKHNQPRYLRVVRLIPLAERPESLVRYKHRLSEILLDPKKTVTAALRLEALGTDSIDILKQGLQSEHALVRFCSAEALAYLGSPASGEELARAVQEQPALRAFGLTALASLDEAVSHVKLRELLSSTSAEARYGAFRALRALDEREPSIQGDEINESFWVHKVAPHSAPLIHLSYSRRAEVVLFGDDILLQPPFSFLAGEFTLTAGRDDDKCTVSRLSVRHGTQRRQCSPALDDVLKTLGEMGGTYPQVVEFLRQASTCQCLTCAVAVDALPQATSVYYLAQHGADDPDFQKGDDAEIRNARSEFPATPALFDKSGGRRPALINREDAAALRGRKSPDDQKTAERE